ncbi:hypothetical protein [Streptomyces sp. NPDC001250]|uniref:hypothetical protein n=1 Tax=unclassified Streptomyces TaxID=2593676 RepID=UPI0033280BC3
MSKRQIRKMLDLIARGEPAELTIAWASVKKAARLAFVAQQFGYEYADARYTGSRNNVLKLLVVPDPSPEARNRAAQNWAQYPNAADGESLPPVVPDAFELLKARIQFDLTGKSAEKRMLLAAGGLTVGLVLFVVRKGGGVGAMFVAGVVWVILMAIFGIGFAVTRGRNAKFANRLQAAGFTPVTDETGRVRYLPPGAQVPGVGAGAGGQAGPYGAAAYGQQGAYAPSGQQGAYAPSGQQGSYGQGPYGQQPSSPGPYAPQGYPQAQAHPQPQQYGQPQPQPYPQPQQAPGPYAPQQPYPQQPQPPHGYGPR